MTPAVFEETCRILNRSLPNFVVGMFGGEPTLHPKFEELCDIMIREIPEQRRRGLWTSHLHGKGAKAKETWFPSGFFNLNAHCVPSAIAEFDEWLPGKMIGASRDRPAVHSATLVAIKDFIGTREIPTKAAMWERIATCDIDRDWSGAVIEREGKPYLYSCELHSGFDLAYDENNGVLLTDDSIKGDLALFANQYRRWCPNCGVALRLKGHQDSEDTDDVSNSHLQLVQLRQKRKFELHENLSASRCEVATDYERLRSN
jgi:hypothetical protein